MQTLPYIGLLGGAIAFAGYLPQIKAIIRGEDKPLRVKWLIWTLSNALILLSYYELGARETIWMSLAFTVGPAIVTVLSFIYGGRQGWGLYDQIYLVIAAVAAVRWVFFGNVLFALIINLAVTYISYIPRIRRLAFSKELEPEKPEDWALYAIGAALTVIAIPEWTIEIALLPVVVFFMNSLVLTLAFRNRRFAPPVAD